MALNPTPSNSSQEQIIQRGFDKLNDSLRTSLVNVDPTVTLPVSTSPVDTGALVTLTAAAVGGNTADLLNTTGKGLQLGINITAIAGTTPTLTVTIQGKDTASGVYYNLLQSAGLTVTGFTLLTVYPGLVAVTNSVANQVLPKTYRILYTVTGTTPTVTATIGSSIIP